MFWIGIIKSYLLVILMIVLTVWRKQEMNHMRGKHESTCVRN
jgi:hypothetical protein